MTKCLRCKHCFVTGIDTLSIESIRQKYRCIRGGGGNVEDAPLCFWETSQQGACGPGAKFFQPIEDNKQ